MASIRKLKTRIKTSKNISKITRAMEMVAASKMKKAQQTALANRPYNQELHTMLHQASQHIDINTHPLLKTIPNGTSSTLIVVLSTDKGLCGPLNTNLFKFIEKNNTHPSKTKFITIGKKATNYWAKSGVKLIASFNQTTDTPLSLYIRPITKIIVDGYQNNEFSQVQIFYSRFINTLEQQPKTVQLLPLGQNQFQNEEINTNPRETTGDYIFEPTPDQFFESLLSLYLKNRLYQLILETKASEQSARMIAMKNAHDSAKDLVSDLQLTYNRQRQARITNELLDVVSSTMALN